jgi:Cu(I)/Ag(I) efflux system membrane fusion protein
MRPNTRHSNASMGTATKVTSALLLLAIGAAAGWWWGRQGIEQPTSATQGEERKVLYWYDPMVPQQHFDQPGKSPFMDMDLVPRYADESSGEGATESGAQTGIRIDAQVAQNLGLREARVERIALASRIDASGVVGFNEREVTIEQVRSAGLVERVWPLAPGDAIVAGQPLLELRVPQWSAAQAEFLAVRGDSALADAARARLRMLGQTDAMIAELEQSGRARQTYILRSSRAGVLQTLDVRSGMSVEPGQTLARIQGIDTLWLEVAVPETRATAVHHGDEARVLLAAYPGRELSGRVIAVLPELAPGSRTLRVRIELPNPSGQLRAGMSAQVQLSTQSGETALAVPTEAVIRTGKRSLVIAVREQGGFEPVAVELGPEIDDRTVVTAGLAEGRRIVASGQFLLDSEASLSGAFTGEQP